MSKYESYQTRNAKPRRREIHPIWRGVGFGMIILIPILSYLGTLIILEENSKQGWFSIPRDLISPVIEPYFYVKIIFTLVLIFVFSVLFMFVTAILTRLFAPPRYDIYDVPPQAFRGKKKSR